MAKKIKKGKGKKAKKTNGYPEHPSNRIGKMDEQKMMKYSSRLIM